MKVYIIIFVIVNKTNYLTKLHCNFISTVSLWQLYCIFGILFSDIDLDNNTRKELYHKLSKVNDSNQWSITRPKTLLLVTMVNSDA